jgi:uncharacterized protein YndB with AHSA1/START domain
MTTETTTSLRLSRTIAASPEEVFRAWTDPAEMKEWYCPEGGTVDLAEVDLTVGGRFKVAMRMPDGVHVAYGIYREIDPPRKLVFTWQWESGDGPKEGETVVTLEFKEHDGATELVLTHEQFATAESRDGHEQGWASALNKLEARFGD